jgi:uncharacterized membrane protein YgaE (UPF0421/DUF939 family)
MDVVLKIVESFLKFLFQILPYLGGISAFVFAFLFFKQTRRIKTAQAAKSEIDNILEVISAMQEEREKLLERIDRQDKRIEQLEERDNEHRYEIVKKDMEIVDMEGLLVKYKRIFNHGCEKFDSECPMGVKYRELLEQLKSKMV